MTFQMWNWFHWVFIASPFIFTGILYYFTRKQGLVKNRKVGLWLSILAVFILFLRNAEIFVKNGFVINAEMIPFQICHFANFVLLFAFWKNNKVLFALAFCLNLPAALLSIFFANSLVNYTTLISFRAQAYLWGHMLIVGITLWSFLVGFIKIKLETFLKTIVLMIVLYILGLLISNIINALFGFTSNYFYALAPEHGTPLELFYTWGETYHLGWFEINPIYLLATMGMGAVVVGLFYGMYLFTEPKLFKKH